MTTETTTGAAALALGSIALEGVAWAARAVLVPCLAFLLTLASYLAPGAPRRPSEPPQAPEPTREPLEALTVAQLGCRGRRAELLEALA